MAEIKRSSYSLEDEYVELFRTIAATTRRTMTEELRLMLDARAMALGLTPVQMVDPKLSGPRREMAVNY
jgi:hypothetical protein